MEALEANRGSPMSPLGRGRKKPTLRPRRLRDFSRDRPPGRPGMPLISALARLTFCRPAPHSSMPRRHERLRGAPAADCSRASTPKTRSTMTRGYVASSALLSDGIGKDHSLTGADPPFLSITPLLRVAAPAPLVRAAFTEPASAQIAVSRLQHSGRPAWPHRLITATRIFSGIGPSACPSACSFLTASGLLLRFPHSIAEKKDPIRPIIQQLIPKTCKGENP